MIEHEIQQLENGQYRAEVLRPRWWLFGDPVSTGQFLDLETPCLSWSTTDDFYACCLGTLEQVNSVVGRWKVNAVVDPNTSPITEDWLRSIGFEQNRPCHVWGTPNVNWWSDQYELEISEFNDTGEYNWVEYDSIGMKTRGDLRRLMAWVKQHTSADNE